ncbi:MAG: 50S ribosomal protein L1 [Candidatus Levybacteria bacterium]|nr:50S ribosomal protein L1 [Candidatus Levybacteria bacterium]
MGKIRVKTLGDESLEQSQKKEARLAREARQAKKRQEKKRTAKAPGLKGGERVVAVGPTEEEQAKLEVPTPQETKVEKVVKVAKKEKETRHTRKRGRKYQAVAEMVDKNKRYSLGQALELLPKLRLAKFDETVELHINTIETGLSGNLSLPHGSGKKVRVAIADEKLIADIEKGKIEFDILLATPEMMPKLAKVAKYLGPRGLMPNPKTGTITQKPEEEAKKYEAGALRFKTEQKAPIIHLTIGKLSFGEKKLSENIKAVFSAIQAGKIKNATLKSTMSPGIKLEVVNT